MNWRNYIVSDENILLGKPVLKGSRISVELILELLAAGWTKTQIHESYPFLNEEHLEAIFTYLKEGMEQERLFFNN
jgi:uncharacterized protein (DUF433 family)